MARLPPFKAFHAEDYKDAPPWFADFLRPLNEFVTAVTNALTGRLTRAENLLAADVAFDFTTAATAANTFPIRFKNSLPVNVSKVTITAGRFAKYSGAALTGPWSMTVVPNQAGEFEVSFQGLENSTRYTGILAFSA